MNGDFMYKKVMISMFIILSFTISLYGCENSQSIPNNTTNLSSTTINPYALKEDGIYSCSKEPITLTCFSHWQDNFVLSDNMAIPNEMSKFTNVTLQGVALNYGKNSNEAFELMINSNKLPDIIGGKITDINRHSLKSFIPLNDLIEEYAPNINEAFLKYPDAKAQVTYQDGNIYSIPFIYETVVSQAWFIREDWLDILGMKAPTNFEEFEEVMYAFRDNDLNGNSIADEIAFFRRKGIDDNKLSPLLQLFGLNTFWHTNEDGKVQIGTYQEEFKDAMKYISKWYEDRLIDPEIFTTDNNTRERLYSKNNGGITFDWIPSTSAYNDYIEKYTEEFYLTVILPPEDINGDIWTAYSRNRTDGYSWGISVDNKDVVASIKFMDFLFSKKGRDVTTYGIEGETFNYNDEGQAIYEPNMFEGDESLINKIYEMGGSMRPMAFLHDATYEYQIMHAEGEKGTELYTTSGIINAYLPQLPTLSLTIEELEFIDDKYQKCQEYILKKIEEWTYDSSLIDIEFDEYMQTLYEMGMNDIIEIYQSAYNKTIK